MTLLYIVLATFAGGLLSVVIAASLTVGVLSRAVQNLVSLSTGVLSTLAIVPLGLIALVIAYRTVPTAAANVIERARSAGEPV